MGSDVPTGVESVVYPQKMDDADRVGLWSKKVSNHHTTKKERKDQGKDDFSLGNWNYNIIYIACFRFP